MWYNFSTMKKGFTLVELMIVVVVLVALMSITFRLSSISSNQTNRSETVAKLQKLENCLSGYYAAYGSYPPVRLQGSRNYKLAVSSHGIQNDSGTESDLNFNWFDVDNHKVKDSEKENAEWEQVKAACKAQPVACRYPYPSDDAWETLADAAAKVIAQKAKTASGLSETRKSMYESGFTTKVTGSLGPYQDETEWNEIQIFQFGLMSYLLPRFVIMMAGDEKIFDDYAQWTENNTLPCDPMDGKRFSNWKRLRDYATSDDPGQLAHATAIPSQAVCARWMPNLAGICQFNQKYSIFGIDIRDEDDSSSGIPTSLSIDIYSPGGYDEDSTSGQYILDGVTVLDGWNEPFYYYSPYPHQSYVLWSSGPNKRTFPPWVAREELDGTAAACVGYWTEDDIVSMSN